MAKLFTPNDPIWVDEALVDDPLYNVKEEDDTAIHSNVKIELATEVTVAGTSLTAARMNNIEDGLDAVDDAVNVEGHDAKTTPVDADEVNLWDSVASAWKSLSWANIKATLKAYFDTLYQAIIATTAAGDFLVGNGTVWEKKTKLEAQTAMGVRVREFGGPISNPQALYAVRPELFLKKTRAALTILSAELTLSDYSPGAEFAGDLMFADDMNVGSYANATLICALDTTNGVISVTSGFGDDTVPSGKFIYLKMDSSPHVDIKDMLFGSTYSYDAQGRMMDTYTSQPDAAAGIDSYVQKNSPTANFGTNTGILYGAINSIQLYRGFIKFDLSSIPVYSVVSAATLYLTQTGEGANQNGTFNVYRLKVDWVEGEATWNIRKTGTDWTAAGGFHADDCEQTEIASIALALNEANGEKEFSLDISAIQEMVSGSFANNGFLLKVTDETVANYHTFASSDHATADSRPKLVIEYTESGGSYTQMEDEQE